MLDTSGDNLHEISNPYFLGQMKKSIISLLLVDFAQSVLNVKVIITVSDYQLIV